MKPLRLFTLSLFLIGAANAALVTYNSSGSTIFTPITLTLAPDVPLFDPTNGFLTEVLIDLDGTFEGDFSFQNLSDADGPIGGSASSGFKLVGPGVLGTLIVLNPSFAFGGTVNAGQMVLFSDVSDTALGSY